MKLDLTTTLEALTEDQRLHFYELLAHNLTITIRGIWSDELISDSEKVTRIKWVNEVLHKTTSKIWTLRLDTHEWTEDDFSNMITGYAKNYIQIKGGLFAAIERSLHCCKKVKGKSN